MDHANLVYLTTFMDIQQTEQLHKKISIINTNFL